MNIEVLGLGGLWRLSKLQAGGYPLSMSQLVADLLRASLIEDLIHSMSTTTVNEWKAS